MSTLIHLDAPSIAAGVNAGRLDPVEVTDAFLCQVARLNPSVNAIIDHDESGPRREAESIRRQIADGAHLPMAGVPIVVKDSIWVMGRRITQGSALFRDFRPDRDALPVSRLRDAGAVVLGLGNMPELGAKEVTDNRLYGETRNPLDLSRTPGGSSGGCAAALAADMAPVSLGGDGGGSARRPPAHVGAVGFKPTPGAVADPWGFPSTLPGIGATCPMGRTVADVRLAFAAIAGTHPLDRHSIELATPTPRPVEALRFACSPHLGLDLAIDDDMLRAFEDGIERLRARGVHVARADPPWAPGTSEADILAIEDCFLAAQFGGRWQHDPAAFDAVVGMQIERGLARSGADLARSFAASDGMARAMAEFFSQWDLLLCPTLACAAWPLGQLFPDRIGGRPARHRDHAAFTPLFNHARTPAISLPCGTASHGLPGALQLVGPRGSDWLVLEAAASVERMLLQR